MEKPAVTHVLQQRQRVRMLCACGSALFAERDVSRLPDAPDTVTVTLRVQRCEECDDQCFTDRVNWEDSNLQ